VRPVATVRPMNGLPLVRARRNDWASCADARPVRDCDGTSAAGGVWLGGEPSLTSIVRSRRLPLDDTDGFVSPRSARACTSWGESRANSLIRKGGIEAASCHLWRDICLAATTRNRLLIRPCLAVRASASQQLRQRCLHPLLIRPPGALNPSLDLAPLDLRLPVPVRLALRRSIPRHAARSLLQIPPARA
jgi:hypothetical protein